MYKFFSINNCLQQRFPNCAPWHPGALRKHVKVVVLTAFLTIIAVSKLLAATFSSENDSDRGHVFFKDHSDFGREIGKSEMKLK